MQWEEEQLCLLGALLIIQPPWDLPQLLQPPESQEAAKCLVELQSRASSQAGRASQPERQCPCQGCDRVRNCQSLGSHPAQAEGKAGAALHSVHPDHGNSSICQSEGQAGCRAMPYHAMSCCAMPVGACGSTSFPHDLQLSLVTATAVSGASPTRGGADGTGRCLSAARAMEFLVKLEKGGTASTFLRTDKPGRFFHAKLQHRGSPDDAVGFLFHFPLKTP